MNSIALCLLLAGAVAAQEPDYCAVESCEDTDHTMCVYNVSDVAERCGPVERRGVSDADETAIVSSHNRIRAAVGSGMYASRGLPAATMPLPPLEWDPELATIAQRSADNCVFKEHGMCNDVARFEVGMNDAFIWAAADEKNWTETVENRFFMDQLENFKQKSLMFVRQSESDMYPTSQLSQLLWAGTTKVGCGYLVANTSISFSETGENFDDSPKHYYICLYGPAGNIDGQYIYK